MWSSCLIYYLPVYPCRTELSKHFISLMVCLLATNNFSINFSAYTLGFFALGLKLLGLCYSALTNYDFYHLLLPITNSRSGHMVLTPLLALLYCIPSLSLLSPSSCQVALALVCRHGPAQGEPFCDIWYVRRSSYSYNFAQNKS